ncbi:MAG: hypothetical protein ACTSYD_02645 [Candidatus Heimdallarchaeaceae archaeon]
MESLLKESEEQEKIRKKLLEEERQLRAMQPRRWYEIKFRKEALYRQMSFDKLDKETRDKLITEFYNDALRKRQKYLKRLREKKLKEKKKSIPSNTRRWKKLALR